MNTPFNQKAITLLELLIVMALVTIVLTATVNIIIYAEQSKVWTEAQTQIALLAQKKVAELKTKPFAELKSGTTNFNYSGTFTIEGKIIIEDVVPDKLKQITVDANVKMPRGERNFILTTLRHNNL